MIKYIIFCLLFFVNFCTAQISAVKDKTDYPFWLSLPEKEILDNNPPILIFLHGRSLSGTDLNRVKRYGVIKAIEKGQKIPAIVIAPQLASGPWNAKKVIEILDYIETIYPYNKNRVYVCGMSLGGYGTMEVIGKYPEKITAGVAICGGGIVSDACNLAKVPLWVIHGTADKAVSISESEKIVSAIKKCNSNAEVEFTRVKGASHGSVESYFHHDEIYDWMFGKTK